MAAEQLASRPMKISEDAMKDAQINIAFRDHCAHKLVDLNECRRENYYLPWTCQHEKHSYEKCQYKEYILRCKAMVEQQQAAAAADAGS